MDARTAFVAQSNRLQLTVAAFAIIVFATALIYPRVMIFEWIVGLPLLGYQMWQLRCWNCHERLIANGGSQIEYRRRGLLWEPCRHKKCGAPLH